MRPTSFLLKHRMEHSKYFRLRIGTILHLFNATKVSIPKRLSWSLEGEWFFWSCFLKSISYLEPYNLQEKQNYELLFCHGSPTNA